MMIRCPNPEHEDRHPSAHIAADGFTYCHSRCGWVNEQFVAHKAVMLAPENRKEENLHG